MTILSAGIINAVEGPYFTEDFENGTTGQFSNDGGLDTFEASTADAYAGSYSLFVENNTGTGNYYAAATVDSSGVQPSQSTHLFHDASSSESYGGAVRFLNSNGNVECSFMSDNFEWAVQDANGITGLSSGNSNWTSVTTDYDWSAGTFTTDFQQERNGSTSASHTGDLRHGVDISTIRLSNYTSGRFDDSKEMYFYFDNFEVAQ
jgi:hypothetical protein